MRLLRRDVREHGNNTDTAEGADRNDLVVIAGIDVQAAIGQRCKLRDLAQVARSLLDRDDVLDVLREANHCLRKDIRSCAGRHVVDDARKLCGAGDLPVMRVQAVLRRLVIVRRHKQERVRAKLLRFLGHHDSVRRIVGAGTGDDGNASLRALDREADRLQMLRIVKRRCLTGGSADNQCVCSFSNLILDQRVHHVVIDLFVLFHRCHQRDTGSSENSRHP